MGVPKQVKEMEAEGDKEIAANAEPKVGKPAETVGVDNAAPKPNAEQVEKPKETATENAGKADLLSHVGEQPKPDEDEEKRLQRESSFAGRLAKMKRDNEEELNRERKAYEAKIEELETKIAELGDKLSKVKIGDAGAKDGATDEELFAEIRKEYSEDDYSDEDLKRFIRIVKRVGSSDLTAFKKRFAKMDEEEANRARRAAKDAADSFLAKLSADFPGFRELDANNDPRWIKFLGSSLGGVMEGTTYGDIAKQALVALDYRKFSSVVREFAKVNGISFSPNGVPADGSVTGQIRPNSVAAPKRGEGNVQKLRIVPMAEIEEFRRAAFAHKAEAKYGLTAKQVAEQLRFYEDAEAEGRVS